MKKIGIIGAGSMGRGIAQQAAISGYEVVLVEIQEQTLNEAFAFIQKMIIRLAEKGKIGNPEAVAAIGRIYCSTYLSSLEQCDLVIEAVIEDLELKKSIFKKVEDIVSQDCVLASNTSSLSITNIAGVLKHPSRMIGMHFFNPVPLMKLVEIIPAIQTKPELIELCKSMMIAWDKYPVVAKDTPGFIVNKVARPYYSEALRIYDEGIATVEDIDHAMTDLGGFKMGPFTLMDYIGNDVNYAVTESVFEAFYYDPRYKPSFTQKRLTEAGWLGRKTGKGYYTYIDGKQQVTQEEFSHQKKVFHRILAMLINEAADTMHMGIASRDDIDIAVTKGVNYPKGLLQWADDIGVGLIVNQLDELYHHYREDRYRCSGLLRTVAEQQSTFYNA